MGYKLLRELFITHTKSLVTVNDGAAELFNS